MSTQEPVIITPIPAPAAVPNGDSHVAASASGASIKSTFIPVSVPNGSGGSHPKKAHSASGFSVAGAAHKDLINRGVYRSNTLGTSTFIGLRALDPLLQFALLRGTSTTRPWGEALLSRLGIASIPLIDHALITSPDTDISTTLLFPSHPGRHTLGSFLGLPTPRLILLLMATGSSLKQIFWLLRTSREEFTPSAAITVSVYNTLVNSLASLLLLAVPTSASLSPSRISLPFPYLGTLTLPLPMAVGSALYISGLTIETAAEIHRKRFKDNPSNKGAICDTGLWSKARHVNYAGYTLWRTGYALAAGGWIAGALVAAWHGWVFATRSIGLMDEYMSGRYKEKWVKYKEEVPWKMFPFIY